MPNQSTLTIHYKDTQIATRLANHFFSRLRGLLCTKPLAEAEALLIMPCNSIHTLGMPYAIDVVFLSPDFQIVHIVTHCQPARFFRHNEAKHTVELLAGQVAALGLKVGMQLTLSTQKVNFNRMKA